MKKALSGIAFAVAAICLTSSTATATPTLCASDLGSSVVGLDCTLGGLEFSNFTVNGVPAPPGTTIFLTGTSTSAVETDLSFQLATPWNGTTVTTADTTFLYTVSNVTGLADIVGVNNLQSGGAGVVIQEIVCNEAFVSNVCPTGHTLTNFSNPPTGSGSFAAQSTIYILKDISQNGPNASISNFTNSVETSTVPEPASLSMMGLGLLGLGLIGRRKRKV
jgi:hypothetical protein